MFSNKNVDQMTFADQFKWDEVPDFSNHKFVKMERNINWDKINSGLKKYYKN